MNRFPSQHHFLIKGQQVYTIINVSVFMDIIQKKMDTETDIQMNME